MDITSSDGQGALSTVKAKVAVEELLKLLEEMTQGALLRSLPGQKGISYTSNEFVTKGSSQTADNVDKENCGGNVFDFPPDMIQGHDGIFHWILMIVVSF